MKSEALNWESDTLLQCGDVSSVKSPLKGLRKSLNSLKKTHQSAHRDERQNIVIGRCNAFLFSYVVNNSLAAGILYQRV